jgi:hypothetical protein
MMLFEYSPVRNYKPVKINIEYYFDKFVVRSITSCCKEPRTHENFLVNLKLNTLDFYISTESSDLAKWLNISSFRAFSVFFGLYFKNY